MASPKPLTDEEGEVRELTEQDFAQAVPFSALSADLQTLLSSPVRVVPDSEAGENCQPAA